MRSIWLGAVVGTALTVAAVVEAPPTLASQPKSAMDCTRYVSQDPAFRVRDLKISGTVTVSWTPAYRAHGMPSHATGFVACNVAAELAVNAAFLWGEQAANVPSSDVTSGVGPKGHRNVAWTSQGWTHHTGGSVKAKKVFWTFHQSGTSGTVTFEMDCAHRKCSAV